MPDSLHTISKFMNFSIFSTKVCEKSHNLVERQDKTRFILSRQDI